MFCETQCQECFFTKKDILAGFCVFLLWETSFGSKTLLWETHFFWLWETQILLGQGPIEETVLAAKDMLDLLLEGLAYCVYRMLGRGVELWSSAIAGAAKCATQPLGHPVSPWAQQISVPLVAL